MQLEQGLSYTKNYNVAGLIWLLLALHLIVAIVLYRTLNIEIWLLIVGVIIMILLSFLTIGSIKIKKLQVTFENDSLSIYYYHSKREIIVPFNEITSFTAVDTVNPKENVNVAIKELKIIWRSGKFSFKEEFQIELEKELLADFDTFATNLCSSLTQFKEKYSLDIFTKLKLSDYGTNVSSIDTEVEQQNSFIGSTWFFVFISFVMLFSFYFVIESYLLPKSSMSANDWIKLSLGITTWSSSYISWSVRRKLKKQMDSTNKYSKKII